MTATHPIDYLTPSHPSFWRWEGDSITLTTGQTLTFRQELAVLIRHLHPFGLPPIESLLLLLAATRDQWDELAAHWRLSLKEYHPDLIRSHLPKNWEERFDSNLAQVHQLAPTCKRDPRAVRVIAEIVFEGCEQTIRYGEKVLDLLERGFIPPEAQSRDAKAAAKRFVHGLHPLLRKLPELTPERLAFRLRTGLDSALTPLANDRPLALQVRSLLAELEGDPQWQGLARLTKDLMATVHVPRALADPEDLPLGGFSDVTNRGSLDRLLVSELAQDDLVLSVRLALNEALYLRRESPPKAPQNARLILIDNGIRLWGIPRLFATAVALAMEAMTEPQAKVSVFVPTQHQQLKEVALHTRPGLTEALSHLHSHTHPGNALLELTNQLTKDARNTGDLILITHADVIENPSFQSVMALLTGTLYIAAIDRQGRYAFYQYSQQHRKTLRQAQLNLNDLLQSTSDQTLSLIRTDVPPHLPAIFHQQPFPIRLPLNVSRERLVFTKHEGLLKISKDGRLLHFPDEDKGGIQISDRLPHGRPVTVFASSSVAEGQFLTASHNNHKLTLCYAAPHSEELKGVVIKHRSLPLQINVLRQLLIVVSTEKITVHDPFTGEMLTESLMHSKVSRCFGDLVFSENRWYRISIDGMNASLIPCSEEAIEENARFEEFLRSTHVNLRKSFQGVAVDETGTLVLMSKSRNLLCFAYHAESQTIHFRPYAKELSMIPFEKIAGPHGTRYRLQQAKLTPDHTIILDNRGLLHLPNLTLILIEHNALSGWSQDHGHFGDPYFFTESPTAHPDTIAESLKSLGLEIVAARTATASV